jgi:hypothetical protein
MRKAILFLTLTILPLSARTSNAAISSDNLRIFIDCDSTNCSGFLDYFHDEIKFADHVRDRQQADVHVLISSQNTGSGGIDFTIRFFGMGRFGEKNDELHCVTSFNDSEDSIRNALLQTIKLGLMPYIAQTETSSRIKISLTESEKNQTTPEKDPWNFWVFRTRADGNLISQSLYRYARGYGNASACRITDDWKIELDASGSYSETYYEFSDGTSYTSYVAYYSLTGALVKSLNQHWSASTGMSAGANTYSNEKHHETFSLAAEYNIYPYSESNRRSLVCRYYLGIRNAGYLEPTIFDKLQETLFYQYSYLGSELIKPWGSIRAWTTWSNFFYDFKKYQLTAELSLSLKLFKGFSIDLNGYAAWIHDQIYLSRTGLTQEEVLTQRKMMATDHTYDLSIGISYTFGSIFNNIVNARFGS